MMRLFNGTQVTTDSRWFRSYNILLNYHKFEAKQKVRKHIELMRKSILKSGKE